MVTTWISGFCVASGLVGVILAASPTCFRPELVPSVGMLVGGFCLLGLLRLWKSTP